MTRLLRQRTLRRLVTVPTVYVLLTVVTAMLPLLILVASVIDSINWIAQRRPAMALRMLAFAWLYLVAEAWAIVALAVLALLPRSRSIAATYAAQRAWLAWNFAVLRRAFSLTFVVEGHHEIAPGPILLMARHSSIVDTLLPARFVVRPYGIRLRYVLKKELVVDPALDIAGHRLPNYFIDRSGDRAHEMAGLRRIAQALEPDEGVLIYPEGTRYTDAKHTERVARWEAHGGPAGATASTYRWVLPPQPAGTLALLEETEADVVILAHTGLEGLAGIADVWNGGLVGREVRLRFRRIPRSDIPTGATERLEWLFTQWAGVDAWIGEHMGADGPVGRETEE